MFKPQELQFTFTAKRSCSQLLQSINSSWNFSEGRTHWSMMQSNTNVRRSEALLNEQQWQQIERLLEYWAVNHVTAVNPAALHWRNISTRSSWGTRSLEQLRHVLLCRRSALRLPSVLCWDSGRCCGCTSYSTSAMDSCKKWHKTFIKKKKQRLYYMKAETICFIITPKCICCIFSTHYLTLYRSKCEFTA